jgi:hypothetical protein
VRSIKHGGIVCFLVTALIGCSSHAIKPGEASIRKPVAPTDDSVRELFDVLRVDDLVSEVVELERPSLMAKLQASRHKGHPTPAQEQVGDEFFGRVLSVVEEELSVDRVEQILLAVVRDSFSQQDVDAMTSFYGTKAGKSVLADLPQAVRAYAKQKRAIEDTAEGAGSDQAPHEALPPSLHAFFKPWENPGYAQFFESDIGQDIESRWPAASLRYDEATEKRVEQMQTRLRQLSMEYQKKINAAGTR